MSKVIKVYKERLFAISESEKPDEYPTATRWIHATDGVLVISQVNEHYEMVLASYANNAWFEVKWEEAK